VGGSFHCWKFLPIIGKYVVNVLEDVSNGGEKDRAWMWKATMSLEKKRGVHEKVIPRRELRDLE
jgi:sarcosine oxidase/L-pipecolate oxidase